MTKIIKVNCDYCGRPFSRYECNMTGKNHFCNSRCSALYYKTHGNCYKNRNEAVRIFNYIRKLPLHSNPNHILTSEEIDNIPGLESL